MKPDRPVLAWAESLEGMRTLYPRYLVPSRGRHLQETDNIDEVLDNYERAVRYVHDETVKLINEGRTLEEIRQQVQLPDELAQLPYLQQGYGKVEWAVNGIFRQYTGWYSLNPTDLNPSPRAVLDQAIVQACGSPAPLMRRARQALQEGDNQLVLELTEIVLQAQPQHQPATMLRMRALRRLGARARNGVEQNIYRVAAQMLSE
jgi:alkyl sulfatase BDS1-like metallo-beta-lactamase superfamily hydrolase